MAHKSKAQRRRASERRQARKAAVEQGRIEPAQVAQEPAEEKKEPARKRGAATTVKDARLVAYMKGVAAEMHRVTWPTREDVMQWTGVVIAALAFFGVYVAGLDNVVSLLLVGFTGLAG